MQDMFGGCGSGLLGDVSGAETQTEWGLGEKDLTTCLLNNQFDKPLEFAVAAE